MHTVCLMGDYISGNDKNSEGLFSSLMKPDGVTMFLVYHTYEYNLLIIFEGEFEQAESIMILKTIAGTWNH